MGPRRAVSDSRASDAADNTTNDGSFGAVAATCNLTANDGADRAAHKTAHHSAVIYPAGL